MALSENTSVRSPSPCGSIRITRKMALGDTAPDFLSCRRPTVNPRGPGARDDDPLSAHGAPAAAEAGAWGALDSIELLGDDLDTGFPGRASSSTDHIRQLDFQHSGDDTTPRKTKSPFGKWVRTLHRRRVGRDKIFWPDDGTLPEEAPGTTTGTSFEEMPRCHRYSSSESSFAFVTATKSASVSLASTSIFGRARLRSSRGHSRADRSSRASVSVARLSEDSPFLERSLVMDPAVTERSLKRRRILEELISTEESYIGDVRFLMNVYVTILASLPTLQAGLRSSINRNLTDIVELHEELLGDLHRAIPDSEYTQVELGDHLGVSDPRPQHHHQRRSLDAVPEDRDGMSWLRDVPGMTVEPQVAAEVAKVFAKKMNRFFVYEEYGAKYELMIKDIAAAHRTMPQWDRYQKGLETLAASLGSSKHYDEKSKQALTIGDLLVKPIQRVCKYPLLFAELLKQTPVCDCPYSYMEIESALIRLREATGAINRATDDVRTRATLEKTWLLQDRLAFPNQKLDAASKSRIRSFGHIQLCGVLHVCWQTKDGVEGSYMVCLLYRDWLCLASAGKADQIYTIQACLALSKIKVEDVDNGRGLQCHTAPFSWKLVFECDHQLYEAIMTACTPKEESEWRARLKQPAMEDVQTQPELPSFSFLALNIKALGTVFRKPGTIARRISIHRATTVGPKSPLYQVILKNTSVERESTVSATKSSINRSQSLLTTHSRVPVLAPSRADRARLEALLSDVWTQEVLPFPGITVRARSEHLVRSSASSVMRKLSVASFANTFTKRSSSHTGTQKGVAGDEAAADSSDGPRTAHNTGSQEGSATETLLAAKDAAGSHLYLISDKAETRVLAQRSSNMHSGPRRTAAPRPKSQEMLEVPGEPVPVISRTSSANSVRTAGGGTARSPRVSPLVSPCGSIKENEPCKTSSIRSVSRWTRTGIFHRDVMGQGFRSFFR